MGNYSNCNCIREPKTYGESKIIGEDIDIETREIIAGRKIIKAIKKYLLHKKGNYNDKEEINRFLENAKSIESNIPIVKVILNSNYVKH